MRALSIKSKVTAVALQVVAILVAAAALTFLETRRQSRALHSISDAAEIVTGKIMPLVERIGVIRYDVAQVQQWLTDISATRAEDGLDDGEEKAAEYAADFDKQIEHAIQLAADLRLADVKKALADVKASFPPYYETGAANGPGLHCRWHCRWECADGRLRRNRSAHSR